MTDAPPKGNSNIPILTEIITRSNSSNTPSALTIPIQVPPPAHPTSKSHPAEKPPSFNIQAEDWGQWEQKIRERVLRDILGRINFVLEHRIKDSITEVLQNSAENMAKDIKNSLHQTIAEIVSRAVTQEIMLFKKTKK